MNQIDDLNILREAFPGWSFRQYSKPVEIYCGRILTQHGTSYFNVPGSQAIKIDLKNCEGITQLINDLHFDINNKEKNERIDNRILIEYCREWGGTDVYKFTPDRVDEVLLKLVKSDNISTHFDRANEYKKPEEVNIEIVDSWPESLKRESQQLMKNYKQDLDWWERFTEDWEYWKQAKAGNTVKAAGLIFGGRIKDWHPYMEYTLDYLQ